MHHFGGSALVSKVLKASDVWKSHLELMRQCICEQQRQTLWLLLYILYSNAVSMIPTYLYCSRPDSIMQRSFFGRIKAV